MTIGRINDIAAMLPQADEALTAALQWMQKHLAPTPDGRVSAPLQPGETLLIHPRVLVKCEAPSLRVATEAPVEFHRRHTDIHIPLSSAEAIGWMPVDEISTAATEFSDEADIGFLPDPAPIRFMATVAPGECAVMTTRDGHAPCVAPEGTPVGTILDKICIKIES